MGQIKNIKLHIVTDIKEIIPSTTMAAERTFIMIKPDGVARNLVAKIITRFEQRGFKLVPALPACVKHSLSIFLFITFVKFFWTPFDIIWSVFFGFTCFLSPFLVLPCFFLTPPWDFGGFFFEIADFP